MMSRWSASAAGPGWCGPSPSARTRRRPAAHVPRRGGPGRHRTVRHHRPSVLASFAVLQLLVYAGLQVPVGLMLDRVGSRVLIASGAALMAAGQVACRRRESRASAARVLVGAGRRDDLHQRAPPGHGLVASPPGSRDDPGDRPGGPARAAAQHDTAGGAAARARLDPAFLAAASLSVLFGLLVLLVVQDSPTGTAPSRRADPRAGPVPTRSRRGGTRAPAWVSGPTSRPSSPARCSPSCGASPSLSPASR